MTGVDWRQRAYAAQRYGKVPGGKRLQVSRNSTGFVIELKEGATGNELRADPLHVPGRLAKHHPVARKFRDSTAIHEISRTALPRALRIVHAVAIELEGRGHRIRCVESPAADQYGRTNYKPKNDGQLLITIDGHDFRLRMYEKGVGLRGEWERQKERYDTNRLNFSLGYPPSRPTAYDKGGTGELNLEIVNAFTRRQSKWGDRQRWRLEDRLPQLLRELLTLANEAEQRRLQRERDEVERERQWNAAMQHAKQRFIADHHRDLLSQRVRAWQEADTIRAYCNAIEARHGADEIDQDPMAAEWLAFALAQADQIQQLPRMPEEPEVTPEALKPYLGNLSPYGPNGLWR